VRSLVETALRQVGERTSIPFAVRFAGGGEHLLRAAAGVLRRCSATRARTGASPRSGNIGLLESYFDGDLDIEGDLARPWRRGWKAAWTAPSRWCAFATGGTSCALQRLVAPGTDQRRFPYALGPSSTACGSMTADDVPCAYWKEGTRTLEEAQRNKIDHVSAQAAARAGRKRWSTSAPASAASWFHAHDASGCASPASYHRLAGRHGARRDRAARLGGTLQVLSDFRDARREYDKVVSIGTLEHAGRDQLAEVVRAHPGFLSPAVSHAAFHRPTSGVSRPSFSSASTSSGRLDPSLADSIVEMERAGLEVLDIENLPPPLPLTLTRGASASTATGSAFASSIRSASMSASPRVARLPVRLRGMFRSPKGRTHLFQVVFSEGQTSAASYPMSRGFL